jgi:hypothetical protein
VLCAGFAVRYVLGFVLAPVLAGHAQRCGFRMQSAEGVVLHTHKQDMLTRIHLHAVLHHGSCIGTRCDAPALSSHVQ